jgi:hypothetical protein
MRNKENHLLIEKYHTIQIGIRRKKIKTH